MCALLTTKMGVLIARGVLNNPGPKPISSSIWVPEKTDAEAELEMYKVYWEKYPLWKVKGKEARWDRENF